MRLPAPGQCKVIPVFDLVSLCREMVCDCPPLANGKWFLSSIWSLYVERWCAIARPWPMESDSCLQFGLFMYRDGVWFLSSIWSFYVHWWCVIASPWPMTLFPVFDLVSLCREIVCDCPPLANAKWFLSSIWSLYVERWCAIARPWPMESDSCFRFGRFM